MKKIFFSLALIITLILPIRTNALELTKSFEFVNSDSESGWGVIFPSYDNAGNVDGHYLSGNALYKYNLKNELVYEKEEFSSIDEIQIETVYKVDNSNVKGNSDIKISSSNFEVLYGGDGDEYVDDYSDYLPSFDDIGNHDGYILFLCTTSTDLSGVTPGYIMLKVDLNGKVLWQKNVNSLIPMAQFTYIEFFYIRDKYNKEYAYYMIESSSQTDTDIIKKYNYNDNIDEVEPIKTVETSKLIWNFNYSYDKTGEIDGIIIAGYDSKIEKAVIVKYDLDLNELFTYTVDDGVGSFFYSVINSKNERGIYDGYIAVGYYVDDAEDFDTATGIIKKIDYSGNLVWQDTYKNGTRGNVLYGIDENYDETGRFNGYAVIGFLDTEEQQVATFLKYTYPSYKIINQASNEGIINVNTLAYPGDIVKVKVSPRTGYSLKRIVVMTSSGKEVEVDSNGTFVMPDEEVTVLALYNKVSNPDTISACYIVLGIVLLISFGTLIVTKKKTLD